MVNEKREDQASQAEANAPESSSHASASLHKNYSVKAVTTPLPSQTLKSKQGSKPVKGPSDTKPRNAILRSANEDDDLYDPYSDVHDGTLKPLTFERNPWD